MEVLLVKKFIETDSHDVDVEMFRAFKNTDLIMDPKEGQRLTLPDKETFCIHQIEQDLQQGMVVLYEITEISHYNFWSNRKQFLKQHLEPLLVKNWVYDQSESKRRFVKQAKGSYWRKSRLEEGTIEFE